MPTLAPPAVVTPGLIGRMRALVRRIKAHPNYTEVIGDDLGIVVSQQAGPTVVKPAGKAQALPAHKVRISFVKHGHEGVDIESRRGAETAWSYLAFDGYSPYFDNRPPLVADQPEERRYRLRYRDKDQPVGEYSDVYVVTTGRSAAQVRR